MSLSDKSANIESETPFELLANMKMVLGNVREELAQKTFYSKVIECVDGTQSRYVVRFTSVPPEIASYFLAHQEYAE